MACPLNVWKFLIEKTHASPTWSILVSIFGNHSLPHIRPVDCACTEPTESMVLLWLDWYINLQVIIDYLQLKLQDLQEDTEWTDALKKHGIIKDVPKKVEEVEIEPEPKEIKFDNSDDEEAWLEDNDDDEFIRQYRAKRMNEVQLASQKPRFGDVVEITASDYVMQVNRAGEDIWVVLLLYRPG